MTPSSREGHAVVLLDRDGVLNVDRPRSVTSVADLEVVPGAAEGTARLRAAGYALVVITNQACIGRGELTEAGLNQINTELDRRLGGAIADWLVCPHTAAAGCECRKPRIELLVRAQRTWGFDPAATWFVVDDDRDIEAAHRFGCRPALVRTGKGARTAATRDDVAVYDDLAAFADALTRADTRRQPDESEERPPHA